MSARSLSNLIAGILILIGLVTIMARYRTREARQIALEDSLWRITYDLQFAPENVDADEEETLRIYIPAASSDITILDEHEPILDPSLRVWFNQWAVTKNRSLSVNAAHADTYNIKMKFDLRLRRNKSWGAYNEFERLSNVSADRYLRSDRDEFPTHINSVRRVLQEMPAESQSDAERLQWLFDYCSKVIRPLDEPFENEIVLDALTQKQASPLVRAKTFVTLCRAARIPARLVTGFELRQIEEPRPHVWTEVYRENRWVPFDPQFGYARYMPETFLPIRRGGDTLIDVGPGVVLTANYSILRLAPPDQLMESEQQGPADIFDLTKLPVEMHEVVALMLLLPLGALITALFRNIIGIRTLGTFAPALLAMSFIYAAWGTGIVILVVVTVAGLVGRTFLERLHLLMVPRLSIVLTVIIMFLIFCVSLLNYMTPIQGTNAVLLPLVILTILIERFHVTSEEDGLSFAIQLVLGTVVVAAFCYLLLRWDEVGRLMLIYPEAHFFTIAAFILIGRYTGYRLTELWRFRDLVGSSKS